MYALRPLVTICAFAILLGAAPSSARTRGNAGRGATAIPAADACSLLSLAQVSAALEVTSLAGRHPAPSVTSSCIWSDDANASASNRRVTLSLVSQRTFDFGKSMPRAKITPAPGIGDDAYYEQFGSDSPSLVARKGSAAISIRVLNGLKFKPFTLDQEKSREATLAQAALALL